MFLRGATLPGSLDWNSLTAREQAGMEALSAVYQRLLFVPHYVKPKHS